ncbi:MAG TPA: tRNA (adenosine(37)-N6)-threonylcarbamoyltransferase complex ATPase subunit type 1 TsaE [Cyclobacteriaceae bacterium]|nr:tRNA (adenosine(37)-N6)-threonylcarbamoyltransferase complex ATPase subunit type 1 TsaE [Cyclobacteriaceae bacterium]HMV08689.1 tRNA (adenosine(37)-N6)-threonylcarbamoyltransferase complex ATPase subunit type 1 TsaE [Cyclobacteriaceae bacterium]HMV90822.1 tRNA (adenosine(37)-N6)-threonylcarbamoyltransferase complex ATPase subunit type 1 TsaE [Cyclobacteriaceae bacterium]HMX00102.1 tRNA (adenosine(37)-N6)-threonylcarbamoyltransferase complex ATPase subunit type 1 TsaE [Cyclobacteriaceae bacter
MRPDVKGIVFEKVTPGDLQHVAEQLIREAGPLRVIVFQGEMGSGKTTFIKAICHALGVNDGMSSPTFSIVNEYEGTSGQTIYHFDFYRLKNELEAYDIGTEEYLDSGSYCLIEWPEKIAGLLPQKYFEVSIRKTDNDQQRTIAFNTHE